VIHGSHARRREAEQEAVEREVMETPARERVAIALLVAALAVPAVEVLQRQHRLRRFLQGSGRCAGEELRGRDVAPEAPYADAERDRGEGEGGAEEHDQ